MKSVIVKDRKGAYEILKDYIGHTLKDVETFNGSHASEVEPAEIKLTFSDEHNVGILDNEEQECAYTCWNEAAKGLSLSSYGPLHNMMTDRIAEVGPFE